MKLTNLLIIPCLLIPFISTSLKAETIIKTNGTTVKTNSGGGMSISTPDRTIDISEDGIIKKKDDYSPNHNSSSQRATCYQENRQTTRVNGSNRTVVQNSESNCD